MTIVLTGITGYRNRGVEALTIPIIEQLGKQLPQKDIVVLTNTPDYDALRHTEKKAHYERYDLSIRNWGRAVRLRRLMASVQGKKFIVEPDTKAADILRNASLIVAAGGDTFSSDYGNLDIHVKPLHLALSHGVPVVFLAHSIGPFKTKEEVNAFREVADRSLLITVRESLSYKYVTEELKISESIVRQTADPAFLLPPVPREQANAMLHFYGVDPSQPAVALSISQGISRFAGVDRAAHFRAWQQVVVQLMADGIEQIILIPHVQSISANNDDRIVATELIKQFDYDPRLHLAGGNHSAAEFKGIISACDMVIAERMHAAIAGLSTATCTIVIGYSVKADGIMKDMLSSNLPHNEFLIPIQQFIKTEETIGIIRSAWQRRALVVDCLNHVLPNVKVKSRQNFELVGSFLDQPRRVGESNLAIS